MATSDPWGAGDIRPGHGVFVISRTSSSALQWIHDFADSTDWLEKPLDFDRPASRRHVWTHVYAFPPEPTQTVCVIRLQFQDTADWFDAPYHLRYSLRYIVTGPRYYTFMNKKIEQSLKDPNSVFVFVDATPFRPDEGEDVMVLHEGEMHPWKTPGCFIKSAGKKKA